MSELRQARGRLGLRSERDLWFRPTPIRDLDAYKAQWGEGGPYLGRSVCPNCGEAMEKPHVCVGTSAEFETSGHDTVTINRVDDENYTVQFGDHTAEIEVVNDTDCWVSYNPSGDGKRWVTNHDDFDGDLEGAIEWAAGNMYAYATIDSSVGERCEDCGQYMAVNHDCPVQGDNVPEWARAGGRMVYHRRGDNQKYAAEIVSVRKGGVGLRVGEGENALVATSFSNPSISPFNADTDEIATENSQGQRCPNCKHIMFDDTHLCPASLDFAVSSEDGAMTAYIEFDGERYWGSFQPTPDSNPITSPGITTPEDARTWAANIVEQYHQAASSATNGDAGAQGQEHCPECGQFMGKTHECAAMMRHVPDWARVGRQAKFRYRNGQLYTGEIVSVTAKIVRMKLPIAPGVTQAVEAPFDSPFIDPIEIAAENGDADGAPADTGQTQIKCLNCGQFMGNDHICPGPQLVFITDVYGKRHRVRKDELEDTTSQRMLRLYNQYGGRIDGSRGLLSRGNIADDSGMARLRRLSHDEYWRRIDHDDMTPPDDTHITIHRFTDPGFSDHRYAAFIGDKPVGMEGDTPEILRARLDVFYGDTVYQVSTGIGFDDGASLPLANAGDISGSFGRCGDCGAFLDSSGVCNNPKCAGKRRKTAPEAPESVDLSPGDEIQAPQASGKITPDVLESARWMGAVAHARGGARAPAQNQEMMEFYASLNLNIGDGGDEILGAFLEGWDASNLANARAEVFGEDDTAGTAGRCEYCGAFLDASGVCNNPNCPGEHADDEPAASPDTAMPDPNNTVPEAARLLQQAQTDHYVKTVAEMHARDGEYLAPTTAGEYLWWIEDEARIQADLARRNPQRLPHAEYLSDLAASLRASGVTATPPTDAEPTAGSAGRCEYCGAFLDASGVCNNPNCPGEHADDVAATSSDTAMPDPNDDLNNTVPEAAPITGTHGQCEYCGAFQAISGVCNNPKCPGEHTKDISEASPDTAMGSQNAPDDDDTITARGVDYVISEDNDIGEGGPKAKARANIAAIHLVRQLEEEGRLATPEEQEILVRYVGWGAFPQVFDPKNEWWENKYTFGPKEKPPFFDEWKELKGLLSEDEWQAASKSTVNAHYTSPTVIRAMWKALDQMGFDRKSGNILEPAAGVGHFFGMMPDEYKGATRVGVELDDTTAAIAKHLYQNADIRNAGFEETNLPNGFFDLAISNVPFGNFGVVDQEFKGRDKFLTESIHNYFFAKGLKKVKPGGTVAFITSRYTMDSPTHQRVRERLAEEADLVGAIRLPNTAFKGNAGTEVTTDIIFLRKRAEDEPPKGRPWASVQEIEGGDGNRIAVNEYFAENPHMMLGQMEESSRMYARGQAQLVSDGRDLGEALDEAIGHLPGDALATPAGRCPACGAFMAQGGVCNNPDCPSKRPARIMADDGQVDGQYIIENDIVYRVASGQLVEHEKFGQLTKSGDEAMEIRRIRGMVALNEVARRVLRLNIDEASDEQLAAAQEELHQVYDAFVAEYGPTNSTANRRALSGDPALPFLMALETDHDEESNTARKEAIFYKRTVRRTTWVDSADTPADALRVALDEGGSINWARMSALTGESVEDLQRALRTSGAVYETPAGQWATAEEYLSGNVRQRLREAEAAAAINPRYQPNVEALQAIMPRDLDASEIKAALGSGWIPTSDIQAFTKHLFRGADFDVSYIPSLAEWMVKPRSTRGWRFGVFDRDSTENKQIWGTDRAEAYKLLEQALNGQDPTVWDKIDTPDGEKRVVNETATLAAREQQDKIKKEFERWVFDDEERRGRLVSKYNEEFNSEVPREFDGSHLTLPGLGANMPELRPHQKNAVWRITQGDNTLLAHIVGAGKTYAMVGGGMELKRMGLRNKVMYSIPNHMLDQFSADIYRMYPAAKVLGVGSKDLTPAKRAETMSRIATGDWDAVVVTHSALGKLPVSAETQARFVREELNQLRDALEAAKAEDDSRITVKEIEKKIERYKVKLKQAQADAAEKQDSTIEWEDLGVDQLFVDEADRFKNLDFATRRTRLAGVQGKASKQASDMFMKIRSMGDRYGHGKGVCFATGTPISNSVSEMYNMQRFLDYDYLQRKGLGAFDAWASQFGDTVTSIEMKPSGGGYQTKTRFAQFNNVPELKRMFMRFADIQVDPDELNLKRPKLIEDEDGNRRQRGVVAPASDELKGYIGELIERADNLSDVDPSVDNMLKITGDGRKAALDMRLVDPLAEDDPDSKLNRAVANIHQIYLDSTGVAVAGQEGPQNMAQMVFCDLGTPNADGFNVYDDIKTKLVARGVKPEEIAFMQDCKSDDKKFQLFQRVNAGEVRVLIGSTETMGAGTNAQRRLAAMHHLDAPWRPRDVEQREGRILRHGNMNEEVGIFRYLTEGSFDVYNWQLLERKARFIAQVMNRDLNARSVEDIDAQALTYAEMKALATGNPAIIEKVEVDSELRKLSALERSHKQRSFAMKNKTANIPQRIAKAQASIERDQAAVGAIAQAEETRTQRETALKAELEQARERAKELKAAAKENDTPEAQERAERAARIAKSKADSLKKDGAFEITINGRSMTDREKAGRQLRAIESEILQGIGIGKQSGLSEIGSYMGFPLLVQPGKHDGASPEFYVRFTPELAQRIPPKAGSGLTFDDVDSGRRNTNRLDRAFDVPSARIPKNQEAIAGLERELKAVESVAGGAFEHQERLDYLRKRAVELDTIIEELEKPDKAAPPSDETAVAAT